MVIIVIIFNINLINTSPKRHYLKRKAMTKQGREMVDMDPPIGESQGHEGNKGSEKKG